jgi:hypothetical protein
VAALANSTSTATKTWHFKKMLGFVLGFFSGIYFIGPSETTYQLIRLKAPVMRLGTFNRIYQGIH